jgi:hypothetical protein
VKEIHVDLFDRYPYAMNLSSRLSVMGQENITEESSSSWALTEKAACGEDRSSVPAIFNDVRAMGGRELKMVFEAGAWIPEFQGY